MMGSEDTFTGGGEAAALFERAIDRLLRFHPDVVELATALTTEHVDAPMGHALMAYLLLMGTDSADLAAVADELAGVQASPSLTPHEQAHHDAISAWVAGDWVGAARVMDELLVRWPTDLLALAIGHQLDFFLANAAELRDRPGRTLARLDPQHPQAGFVRGMQAFGMEESGHYGAAEELGLAAVAANPDDVWGIHAVAHTFEMQGRVDEGIRFMEARTADWGEGNLFTVHNWWHLSLYYLDQRRHADVLRVYDERIHHAGSAGVPLEMLDASALLARLAIDEVDTGDRFGPLASAWLSRVQDEPWYSFNDFHAVVALAGAGRMADAAAMVARLEAVAASAPDPRRTNVSMTTEVGLPVSRAAVAFFEGHDAEVVATLLPIRRSFARFGGSHAQRDLPARLLVQSAIRCGRHDLARALLDEQLALRPTGTFALDRRAQLVGTAG